MNKSLISLLIFILLPLFVDASDTLHTIPVEAIDEIAIDAPIEHVRLDIGADLALRSYGYIWYVEPFVGFTYRFTVPRGDNQILILGSGVDVVTVYDPTIIPFFEIGFGHIKGRKEVKSIFHFGFAYDSEKGYNGSREITSTNIEVGYTGEFLSFRTDRGNSISFFSPSINMVIRTDRAQIRPNVGISFIRYAVNLF